MSPLEWAGAVVGVAVLLRLGWEWIKVRSVREAQRNVRDSQRQELEQ